MQENIRPIAPIGISGLEPQEPPTGMPIFELVKPEDLFVDPAYQRNISEKGMRQIRRIIEGFDWTSFKPPICAYSEIEGVTILKVLDGQHTAIAAASNPHIAEIPVMIVEARNTTDQAKAFIGQNTDRLAVTTLQLHQAALAAANEDAQTLELVCARANVRVMKSPNAYTGTGARQTIAVKQVEALIARRGPMFAREILEVLANAEIGPLTASQIKAVEMLMTEPKYSDFVFPDDITVAMVDLLSAAEEEAKVFSASHKITFWRALGITWFQKAKKRKQPLARVA
ncbi:hypothetical protein GR239_27780 [Rhizobium leguminosarum]|uniref:hypothetical protein n=1 Tax=Rhizobium ruizarguesonis TaxID=2081791 RepID=UPI0013B6FA74|nr:hypothetical protein [Rhizobium ruizarguesonis]NEH87781.1 hypothetical protein [Rhizobium ruizarguesonis]NEJ60311.1 hypothetical protein [Rhizobium ruizarguesonis]NEJ67387.1 hypothetical protein [Rhizobium ruizarguesonis]NEK04335.1 hypothetical protein [Rhizobium ruizarguesonis]